MTWLSRFFHRPTPLGTAVHAALTRPVADQPVAFADVVRVETPDCVVDECRRRMAAEGYAGTWAAMRDAEGTLNAADLAAMQAVSLTSGRLTPEQAVTAIQPVPDGLPFLAEYRFWRFIEQRDRAKAGTVRRDARGRFVKGERGG